MSEVWRHVTPVRVIYLLLTLLFGLIAFAGKQYDDRLLTLEDYRHEQSRHLHQISEDLREIKTHVEWLREERSK